MNTNKLIKIDDLPLDIQEELRKRQNAQALTKQYEKEQQLSKNHTTINVYNNNTYNINILKNEGTINEKEESTLDWIMKGLGRTAGKAYAELKR